MILLAVRWYSRCSSFYRDLEELLAERVSESTTSPCSRAPLAGRRASPPLLAFVRNRREYRTMAGTNIDLDDAACAVVMLRFRLASKREAVNMALRELATRPLTVEEQRVEWEASVQRGLADAAAGRSRSLDQVLDRIAST